MQIRIDSYGDPPSTKSPSTTTFTYDARSRLIRKVRVGVNPYEPRTMLADGEVARVPHPLRRELTLRLESAAIRDAKGGD